MSAGLPRAITRAWPRSLFGRLAIILFSGLAAAHVLSFGLIVWDRTDIVDAMMGGYFVKDAASAIAILDHVKAEERPAWLGRLDRPNYRYVLAGAAPTVESQSRRAQAIKAALAGELGASYGVKAVAPTDPANPLQLNLWLRLTDGTPLTIEIVPPSMTVSPWVPTALAVQLGVLALFTWIAVKLATQPLVRLEGAANSLGSDLRGEPLPEDGPKEVARAATAFNAMQRRIASHLAERIQILAAVSHDLQTPITRMRLRTDLLADTGAKEKIQCDLREMQTLVEQGLALARGHDGLAEQPHPTDLHALLDSLICDYVDAGEHVGFVAEHGAPILTHPQALRRIMVNLIDNALKFGKDVEVMIDGRRSDRIGISVADRGPGIPDEHLKAVLTPFYRLESSRNRETGGTGLGLAIALQLARAIGGTLTLTNRVGGGLEARLEFPR